MIEPQQVFLFISSVLIISYLSNLIYKKTKIPDIIWLLVFGVLLGPVTGTIRSNIFQDIAPTISSLSIILITFEAGIDIDYETLKTIFPKTITLALATFLSIVLGTGLIGPFLIPELSFIESMTLGTVLGGLSTIAVISIRDQIKIEGVKDAWGVLALESTVVDPFRIMFAIVFIRIALEGAVHPSETLGDIFFILFMGGVVGVVLGVLWSLIIHRLRHGKNAYMITLAVLLQVYYIAEYVAGSGGGTMACFLFGVIFANPKLLKQWLGFVPRIDVNRLNDINREMSFLLKSYYFVYTGLIVSINASYLLAGFVFTVMIVVIRYFIGLIVGKASNFNAPDIEVIRFTYPLGTSAVVFAQLPSIYDSEQVVFTDPLLFTNLVFPVVLGTIIFSALFTPLIIKNR